MEQSGRRMPLRAGDPLAPHSAFWRLAIEYLAGTHDGKSRCTPRAACWLAVVVATPILLFDRSIIRLIFAINIRKPQLHDVLDDLTRFGGWSPAFGVNWLTLEKQPLAKKSQILVHFFSVFVSTLFFIHFFFTKPFLTWAPLRSSSRPQGTPKPYPTLPYPTKPASSNKNAKKKKKKWPFFCLNVFFHSLIFGIQRQPFDPTCRGSIPYIHACKIIIYFFNRRWSSAPIKRENFSHGMEEEVTQHNLRRPFKWV